MTRLARSVLGFLSRYQSNRVTFGPVCMVIYITLKARFSFLVKLTWSSRWAMIKIIEIWTISVCKPHLNSGVQSQWTIFNFDVLVFANFLPVIPWKGTAPVLCCFLWYSIQVVEIFQKFDNFRRFGWHAHPDYRLVAINFDADKCKRFTGYVFSL